MTIRHGSWLAVAAGVAVLAGVWPLAGCLGWHAVDVIAQAQAAEQLDEQPSLIHNLPDLAKPTPFNRQSVYDFLAKAKKAEAIADPLQQCLAYPDPPGSHWSPDAVRAYCVYRTHKFMSYDDVRSLLQHGQYAELDSRLSAMLQEKLAKPELASVMDRALDAWFNRPDLELRTLLDHWKEASPHSAFAYGASGISYVSMAWQARGEKYMVDTPQANIDAMDRFVALADADLRRAVALDARITDVYVYMIEIGRLSVGDAYVVQAAKAGLKADPASFSIYNELMRMLLPKWGGSLQAMTANGKSALMHAGTNPMLKLLPGKALAEAQDLDGDDCTIPGRFEKYSQLFDQVAVASQLSVGARSAESCNHLEWSVVLFSELLRFSPEDNDARLHRAYNLNEFDESAWSASDADRLVHADPKNADYILARGYARESLNDGAQAEKDYLAALALSTDGGNVMAKLIQLYLSQGPAWDKAWAMDQRFISTFPKESWGWFIKAYIQMRQPRPGLKETTDYIAAHFDTSPALHQEVLKLRAAVALQEGEAKKKAAGK